MATERAARYAGMALLELADSVLVLLQRANGHLGAYVNKLDQWVRDHPPGSQGSGDGGH